MFHIHDTGVHNPMEYAVQVSLLCTAAETCTDIYPLAMCLPVDRPEGDALSRYDMLRSILNFGLHFDSRNSIGQGGTALLKS